ncbi:zinc finger protein 391-like [Contarinia nasturtii]|uniref:zinc finger protein 391-like n=1 Tax=Contarinia nasturtii TaxID=265458 RepID=UPI0012D4529C|nr:zinc finger protein 391-like [Contarinia nasturtii]
MDSQLIKVEVEENPNFHCIICKDEFLTKTERNEHLETHFIHCNCKNCSRAVIVIGGLEFELHHPTHCTKNESLQEDVLDGEYLMDVKSEDEYDFKSDEAIEAIIEQDSEIECFQNTKQHTTNAENSNDESSELVNEVDATKKISARKVKRKSARKCTKSRKNNDGNHSGSDVISDQAESEDELIKEMDVAMRKRRKQYAKLPKTIPCTVEQCDAMFGTERTLKIHMHREHGIKERYICPICDREFKISGNLKQHIETHSDYKRFICNFCGKGFHLPFNLKEHMNTHTGDRPYTCDVCGKTFGRNSLRQAHMRVHTGEKPYKCDVDTCDRAYAYQTDLKRHKRAVHGIINKTFPCTICGKIFYENKFLTKHLNVHNENN